MEFAKKNLCLLFELLQLNFLFQLTTKIQQKIFLDKNMPQVFLEAYIH